MIRIETVCAVLSFIISLPAFASVFPYIEPLPRAIFIASLAGGIVAARRGWALRGLLPTLFTIAFFLWYGAQFSRDNLVNPAVNLLVVMLAVRLASEKTPRHHLQIYALSLFVLAGSSLFDLGAIFLVYLLLLLFLIGSGLVLLTFHTADNAMTLGRAELKKVLSVALLLPACSIPLMLLFFVIMPRTQYPMWKFLNSSAAGKGGLSETVRPGSTAGVTDTRNVVFRATAPPMDKNRLYWRGIVLNTYRDSMWSREAPDEAIQLPPGARQQRITIFPEPQSNRYLVGLNHPLRLEGVRNSRTGDLVFNSSIPVDSRVRYDSLSLHLQALQVKGEIDREFYLRLPKLSPRITSLGREIAARGMTAEETIAFLEDYYRKARIRYATKGLPTGPTALDAFLFDKRPGHCEFFASSAAILLRLANVPSRLVGGYYGGSYNELGGYYVVTDDMAHVWVEAYVDGKGWVSIDPSGWAVDFGRVARKEADFIRQLRLTTDAFSYFWNLTVINYDLEKQIRLFSKANEQARRLDVGASFSYILPAILAVGALAAAAGLVRKRYLLTREERILQIFFAAVAKRYGVERTDPAQGLQDFAALVGEPAVLEFVEAYSRIVFHDGKVGKEEYQELKMLIRKIGSGDD